MPKRTIETNDPLSMFGSVRPSMATEFEKKMRELGLTKESCARSEELLRWCWENRHRCYVPEWLLKTWNIRVGSD